MMLFINTKCSRETQTHGYFELACNGWLFFFIRVVTLIAYSNILQTLFRAFPRTFFHLLNNNDKIKYKQKFNNKRKIQNSHKGAR